MEFCGFTGRACVAGREPGCAGHWSHFGDCATAPAALGGGGAQPTAARGKWPNVNSSFWR